MEEPTQPASRESGLRWGDGVRALIGLIGAGIGLMFASWFIPGFDVDNLEQALVAGILISVVGAATRLLLVRGAVWLGWVGAVLLGLFAQAFAIWIVVYAPQGDGLDDLGWSLLGSWIVAAVATLFVWVATADTDDAVTASLLRRARLQRNRGAIYDPDLPGVVFVQADGVPYPVGEWCVRAGTLPTLSWWIRNGSHQMGEWRPMLPATTPASQMGILHGTIDGIPAFRWVDRPTGRVFVANKPGDAKDIEALHYNGRGLLVDDGCRSATCSPAMPPPRSRL